MTTKLRAVEHRKVLQMLSSRHAFRLESAVPVVWLAIDTRMKQGKRLVPICTLDDCSAFLKTRNSPSSPVWLLGLPW